MITLKRIKHSKAAKNAAASYLAFVSTSLCGLLSIPVAVAYLTKEQMGLWTIVYIIVGYLLWMDLGIGNATGRKIAGAIANNDQTEINRWWTLSVGVLAFLGLLLALMAVCISPFLQYMLDLSPDQVGDALWLFLGTAIISAISMPFRAYPGLLIAQERFHWVPIAQAILPWIQFAVFWSLLHLGYGVRAYFPALAFSQICGWAIFLWQVHGHGLSVKPDFKGYTRARFKDLFSYSSSLAVLGIVGALVQSIPAMMLARLGGLSLVPVYNFSNRAPGLVKALSQRTTQSFYPNLQKLYVSGEQEKFRLKYRQLNQLGIWISVIGAGAVLACNRTMISWLASTDFYAGHWANIGFACAVITIPFVGGLSNLLQYSGRMSNAAVFSILEFPVSLAAGWLGFRYGGLAGLAAAFAVLPLLVRGPYALFAGCRNCGFNTWSLCGSAITTLMLSLLLVITIGIFLGTLKPDLTTVQIFGRTTIMPTIPECLAGLSLVALGASQAILRLKNIGSA